MTKKKNPSEENLKQKRIMVSCSRIKKIIQSVDEIGKLSVFTPAVVSKAVELFIKDLVSTLNRGYDSRGRTDVEEIYELAKKEER